MKKSLLSLRKQVLVWSFFFTTGSYAQDGSLDLSFDGDGKVTTDFGTSDYGLSTAIQNDGKIVVAGQSGNFFAVARYNADGSLDNTFDNDGKVTLDFNSNGDFCHSVIVQNDQKIIVIGSTTLVGLNTEFAVARLNSDGSLDNTFGVGGKVTTDVGGDDQAYQVALQNDGKIVVVGTSSLGPDYGYSLVRYNIDGTLDNSFDGDGKLIIDLFFDINRDAFTLAIQADGKIVIGGVSDGDFAVLRFNSNGSLDMSFDGDGKATTDVVPGNTDVINKLVLQSDGKILVTGTTYSGSSSDLALARYQTNGSLDNSFGNSGKKVVDLGGEEEGTSLDLQNDGKIVVGGSLGFDFLVMRFQNNGEIDSTFGVDGKTITDFGGFDAALGLQLQNDGKIIAAGLSDDDFALARYTNGTLSLSEMHDFNTDISIFPNPTSGSTTVYAEQDLHNASLKIFNSVGHCILEMASVSSKTIALNLESFQAGIYFIRVENGGSVRTEKIMKN